MWVASLTLRGGSPVPVRVTVSHVLSLCRAKSNRSDTFLVIF